MDEESLTSFFLTLVPSLTDKLDGGSVWPWPKEGPWYGTFFKGVFGSGEKHLSADTERKVPGVRRMLCQPACNPCGIGLHVPIAAESEGTIGSDPFPCGFSP